MTVHGTIHLIHSCARKVRFKDEDDAQAAGMRTQLYWYRCQFCQGYHLTGKKRGREKQQKLLQKHKRYQERLNSVADEAQKEARSKKKELRQTRKQYLRGEISLQEKNDEAKRLLAERIPAKLK